MSDIAPQAASGEPAPRAPVADEPAPRPKRRGRGCLILTIVMLVLVAAAAVAIPLLAIAVIAGRDTTSLVTGGNVGLIRIEGLITATGGEGDLFSAAGTSSEKVLEQIRRAEKNPRIKVILLRVDSPGGTAAGGKEIADAIRDAKKPVVASVADLGASAAYMIASQADHIVCNQSGLVGSIGVIMEIPNYEELYKKIGVKVVTLHAGKYKDIGNPARPMLPEEREFLEEMLRVVHEQFIADVAKGRKMPVGEVRKLATGLFWTGEQAKDLKLVDEVGGYREALAAAARLGGITGEPEAVEMRQETFWDVLSGDFASSLAREIAAALTPDGTQSRPRIR